MSLEFTEECRLEQITGLKLLVRERDKVWFVLAFEPVTYPDKVVLIAVGDKLKETCDFFLERNLNRLRIILREEQNGRCFICKRAVPLQLHHKVFRSEHRDDRKTNLDLRCRECHMGAHGEKAV